MLAGGVLADGVRDAESEQDHLYEEALWYDAIGRLYGYTPTEADQQPYEMLCRMVEVSALRNKVEERRNAAEAARAGG